MSRTEITSRGIIIKDDKILLMHRRKNGQEYFVLPGGGIEVGETPEEAVAREVYEETGLKVTNLISNFDIIDVNGQVSHIFYLETEEGEPTLVGEEKDINSELDWYNPEWFDISIIERPNVYPVFARERLIEDLKNM